MGRLGVVIADRHGGNSQKGQAYMIYVSLVDQFLHHWAHSLPIIEAGIQAAYAGGDRYYINYGKLCYSFTYLAVSHHLSDALPIAEDAYDEVHKWSTATHQNLMGLSIVRLIKALQGRTYWDTDNVFDGDDGFNDEHFLAESSKPIPIAVIALNWYQSYKMIPLTLYERYDAAVEIGDYCFRTMDSLPCIRHTRVALFYYSISLIGHAREHSESVEKCLKQVSQNQDILYEWVELCRVNYVTLWTLVEAEIAGFQGDNIMKAMLLYEEAINHAREGEWCLELSIAHELAGAFYYQQGIHNVAYNMIKKVKHTDISP